MALRVVQKRAELPAPIEWDDALSRCAAVAAGSLMRQRAYHASYETQKVKVREAIQNYREEIMTHLTDVLSKHKCGDALTELKRAISHVDEDGMTTGSYDSFESESDYEPFSQ